MNGIRTQGCVDAIGFLIIGRRLCELWLENALQDDALGIDGLIDKHAGQW